MASTNPFPSDFDFETYNNWLDELGDDKIISEHEARDHYNMLVKFGPEWWFEISRNDITTMNSYLLVAVCGSAEIEKWIDGPSEKDARKTFWAGLSDSQRDSTQEIECVDVQRHN